MIMNIPALQKILRPRCMAPSALDKLSYLDFSGIQKRYDAPGMPGEFTAIRIDATDKGGNLRALLEYIAKIGNVGHSFTIVVDPDLPESTKKFGWDGDGSDHIWKITAFDYSKDEVKVEKAAARDYKQEYRDYHGKPSKIKERAERNAARSKLGLKVGDPREADHKNPISNGGSNNKRNLRAVSQDTNRRKADKKE